MANNRPRQCGFSLLELIIVLSVMVSLLAIAWPNLQRPLRRTTLSEAAQTLRSAIDDCRYQAITTGEPVFVELRQGEQLLRAGSFAEFMKRDGTGAVTSVSSPLPVPSERPSDGQQSATDQARLKSWRLPQPVVISDVRWTLAAPGAEFAPTTAVESDELAEVQSGTLVDLDRAAAPQTWWLPLVATGQGRDAAIVLFDSSVNQEITVTFASATGALEISR